MEISPNLSGNARYDSEYIIAARSGVDEAFNQLMNKYKFAIYFMLLKMVSDRHAAEDLTVETFGKAFTIIHQYDPRFSYSTWLFRIAYCKGLDYLEKKKIVS